MRTVVYFERFSVVLGHFQRHLVLRKWASTLTLGIFSISETNRIKGNKVFVRCISINCERTFNRKKVIVHFFLWPGNEKHIKESIRKISPKKITPQKIAHEKIPPPRKLPPVKILPYDSSTLWKLPPRKLPPPPWKLRPLKSPPHLQIMQMKEKTKLQNFLPWTKLCNTTSLSK